MVAYGYHVCFLYTLVHVKGLVQSMQPEGMSVYSDGSLQTVEITGSEYPAARAAVTTGPLCIRALHKKITRTAK